MVVRIVDYDEEWPLKYAVAANHIRNIVLDNLVSIYHIGSTAIKGLKARDMIDILIVVKDITLIDELVQQFKKNGYDYGEIKEGYCLKKKDDSFCLYIFSVDEVDIIEKYLAVSLYLQEYQDVAKEFLKFKESIIRCNSNKYVKEKENFFSRIEKDACIWYRSKNIHVA